MIKQLRKKPSKIRPTRGVPVLPARRRSPKEIVSAVPRQLSDLDPGDNKFAEVLALIETARNRAYQAINSDLVTLYWQLGEYISLKIESAEWGDGIVDELAAALARRYSGGFARPNLFRMRQFYQAYRGNEEVSALLRQLPWTHHLLILSQAKPPETREFYILAAIRERWSSRELERQIQSAAILRNAPAAKKVSPAVARVHPAAIDELKNAYSLEFLSIPGGHSEADLFYVEALDRDVKKAHERPSIGVLLSATKDDEVVEYALARTASPTLVAEYQTMLPPKAVIRRKLHELYAQLSVREPDDEHGKKRRQ